jgi:AcrR family transcriptional regulator
MPNTAKRIMEVALDLFTQRGYDGTSMRDIAAELGLSPGAFYHHFPSKEAVLVALCQPLVDGMARFAEQAAKDHDLGVAMLEPYLDVILEHRSLLQLVTADTSVYRQQDIGPPIKVAAETITSALEIATGADSVVAGCAMGALHGGALAVTADRDVPQARAVILRSVQLLLQDGA